MKPHAVSPLVLALLPFLTGSAVVSAQPMAKAAVAEKIKMVENGVDEFRNYLERRGDSAKEKGSSAQAQAAQSGRASRRGGTASSSANTEARRSATTQNKDELEDALGDLNRSTNRLRRKFDATDKWMETKVEVDRCMDDGRKINQYVARGNYGSEVARLWAALRNQMNDLARAYGVAPLGI